MVYEFSEESMFVLKNWATIEELLRSRKRAEKEFEEYLRSLRDILKQKDWWRDNSENLEFEDAEKGSVYISTKEWLREGEHLIWIGIENFNPESVLGYGDRAYCFLWVNEGPQRDKIVKDLKGKFTGKKDPGEPPPDDDEWEGYVRIKYIKQYQEDELEDLVPEVLLNEIADFFEAVYRAVEDYEIK
jgi:hypothetical protein